MQRKIITCDRCHRNFDDLKVRGGFHAKEAHFWSIDGGKHVDIDLCLFCAEAFDRWLNEVKKKDESK